jgi:hypothetical protein
MGDAARDWGGSFWDFELGLTRPWKRSTGSVEVHGAESTGDARVQRRRRDKGGAARARCGGIWSMRGVMLGQMGRRGLWSVLVVLVSVVN